jgi:hypothetical protein
MLDCPPDKNVGGLGFDPAMLIAMIVTEGVHFRQRTKVTDIKPKKPEIEVFRPFSIG